MNCWTGLGRLARDPEIRSNQDLTIARYTLAVDRRIKTQDGVKADFISCVSFGKTAEFISKYCKQGTKLCVSGRIQTGSYTNRDGQKIYTTDVVVEQAEFAESLKAQGQPAQQTQVPDDNGFMPVDPLDDAGLPFGN